MIQSIRTKLSKFKQARRGKLLKDLSPTDLLILCDRAQEMGYGLSMDLHGLAIGFVKWSRQEQIEALCSRFPHVLVELPTGNYESRRFAWAFELGALVESVGYGVTEPAKYIRRCGKGGQVSDSFPVSFRQQKRGYGFIFPDATVYAAETQYAFPASEVLT